MDTLPPELLSKIMLYLPPMDRLESSLVCRRWAETMTSPQLLHDIWLNLYAYEMEAARSVLLKSRKEYTRLHLSGADLTKFDSIFWGKIGENLRVLELSSSSWSADVFYAILQKCTKLESLEIESFGRASIDDFVPPEGVCQEQLRNSLRHLRHLSLKITLTADVLDFLLGLMSNVTSIHLSYFFAEDSDFLERLPSILRKNQISRTKADFLQKKLTSENFIKFVDGTSGTLEELRTNAKRFTREAFEAIIRCTKLRSLTLSGFKPPIDLRGLEKLVSNLPPDLEVLELLTSHRLEFENILRLLELKKLRTLRLRSAFWNVFTNESLRSFEGMSTLVNLNLQEFEVDSGIMQRLGCLKNLRVLELRECPDSECFDAIHENFRRLTELDLGCVKYLTDADGSKLCDFKELRSLTFNAGYRFTDKTFKRGVGSPTMRYLSFDGCSMTDDGLWNLATHHNRLENMILYNCHYITSAGVLALLKNEPRLKWFSTEVRLPPNKSLRDICPRRRDIRV